MSEQPASSAPNATAAATARLAPLILGGDIDASVFRQIEDVAYIGPVDRADGKPSERRRHFRLSHQKEVDIVAGQCAVERRMHGVGRPQRAHDVGRYDDDEVGLVFLISGAAE